jgi:hypothetical protein
MKTPRIRIFLRNAGFTEDTVDERRIVKNARPAEPVYNPCVNFRFLGSLGTDCIFCRIFEKVVSLYVLSWMLTHLGTPATRSSAGSSVMHARFRYTCSL